MKERIDSVLKKLHQQHGWNDSSKTLMITHKMLAKQQGYENLLRILGDKLKNDEDPFLNFFKTVVEPVFTALSKNDAKELFEILGVQRMPVRQKKQKKMWKVLREDLENVRNGTIREVMDCVVDCKLIPIPPKLEKLHSSYYNTDGVKYENEDLKSLYSVSYLEVLSAIDFLGSNGKFSTDHGIKGEEYDNILFVVGRGWNNYKFDDFMPQNPSDLCGKDFEAYIRNRNLFYVCCSRPRKNLVLFVTIPVKVAFSNYLQEVFGLNNILAYKEFMNEIPNV